MFTTRRIRPTIVLGVALAAAGMTDRPARAFHMKQQIQVMAAPAAAPVYPTTAAAPTMTYTTLSAAPAAASTYVIQGSAVSAAPAMTIIPITTTAAAPAAAPAGSTTAAAPGDEGPLLGGAFRDALMQDLRKRFSEQDAGTTRREKVETLRSEGQEWYAAYLNGDGGGELTTGQKRDLDRMINEIVASDLKSGGGGGYYPAPPYQNPYGMANAPYGAAPVNYVYMQAPAQVPFNLVPLVPIQYAPCHKHPWK